MRLIDFLDRGCLLGPEQICAVDDRGSSFTYSEMVKASNAIANFLIDQRVPQDAAVSIVSENSSLMLAAILGVLRSGRLWLPVNAKNAASEVGEILRARGARYVFVDTANVHLLAEVDKTEVGVSLIDGREDDVNTLRYIMKYGRHDPVDTPGTSDTVIAIRSTGGTTGLPKGVLVTNRIYATCYANYFAAFPFEGRPCHLAAAPLSHAAGSLCFPTMALGGTNVILTKVDPKVVLSSIEHHGVTHLYLPPTAIYKLLDSPHVDSYDYSSLKYFIYSAAPMAASRVDEAMERFGPVMAQAYGQAEAPFFCTVMSPSEHQHWRTHDPDRLRSCGRVTPFTRVSIMSDDGEMLQAGEIGEVVVRGDLVMKGYHQNPEETAAVSRFGWHHTGDLGYKDKDGYLFLVDRKRDMIISGGFNIYPGEIEQVIAAHPSVAECAVIGVPDDYWGENVKAIIEVKKGGSITEREIIELCRSKIGKMKSPKTVEIWPELPRNTVGKVLKREIRARYWTEKGRAI